MSLILKKICYTVNMNLKFLNNSKYPNGFTLAEVLITLVIIGVIAAMTVPTLMKNTQNQELVTGLKKANSTLQQALVSMARNNDSSPGDYTFLNTADFADEYAKVANVTKKCNSSADCYGVSISDGTVYKQLNNVAWRPLDGKTVITADGQIFSYAFSESTDGIPDEDAANEIGRIIVDVNGLKGPNVVGRDVFLMFVVNGKGLVPKGTTSTNTCNKNNSGGTCAGRVLKENAMNY